MSAIKLLGAAAVGVVAGAASIFALSSQITEHKASKKKSSAVTSLSPSSAAHTYLLEESNLNPRLLKAEYAVRGELVARAELLAVQLALQKGAAANGIVNGNGSSINGEHKLLPFSEIIYSNVGNPHDLGQLPITYFRQVLSLCHYPDLLKVAPSAFPAEAIERARAYLGSVRGGTGAYTPSQGLKIVRDEVAQFIEKRDGFPSSADDIFLSDGASSAIKSVLTAIIRNETDGIMVPIPQYPLYSATIALAGGELVGYELDESKGWDMPVAELRRVLTEARGRGVTVRALVVINPGNPTGQCLSAEAIRGVIEFCKHEGIVILADEVYQTNVYAGTPFTSFKKVLRTMGSEFDTFELFSFHSVSKGFLGECGQRGGYMELTSISPGVKAQLYKMASISLCSNVTGQLMVGLMCNPPVEGQTCYELYARERDATMASLARRAKLLTERFNAIEGVRCNAVEGALYAFPQITLPAGAVAAAKAAGKAPDTFYCLELLQATGIVVVPGSGFGQKAGTWHFRTTILPPERVMEDMLVRFAAFHRAFLARYSS